MLDCISKFGTKYHIKVRDDDSYKFYCTYYSPCMKPCDYNDVLDSILMGDRRIYRCLREKK